MEKYEELDVEVIAFTSDDIITESCTDTVTPFVCFKKEGEPCIIDD